MLWLAAGQPCSASGGPMAKASFQIFCTHNVWNPPTAVAISQPTSMGDAYHPKIQAADAPDSAQAGIAAAATLRNRRLERASAVGEV